MRDGIYRVDFKPGRPEGNGIAMISDGTFKGLDQSHFYFGSIEDQGGNLIARLNMSIYEPSTSGAPPASGMKEAAGMKEAPVLKLNGKETREGFILSGESAAELRSHYEFKGTWIYRIV